MSYFKEISAYYKDSANLDSFSRLRVSNPVTLFDAQLTYNLQPLLFEQITAESGASISHDTINRCATIAFSSTPINGKAYMQTYEYFRYQPLKSQLVAVTFNFIETATNVIKFAGYSDGNNGIEFRLNGSTKQICILSDTSSGDEIVDQTNWNLDKLDGTGNSGYTLDITKTQILIFDFQALYVGRVRVGFDIDGKIIYAHEFLHSNIDEYPYIQSANLPVRCGMTCSNTSTTTMRYICSAVASEGGIEDVASYEFVQSATVTAGNGTDTHALSIRPKTTFNSITNRTKIQLTGIELLVTGANPIEWKLCIGQALTTPSYTSVNSTYSSVEYDSSGTLSGNPAIIIDSGYVPASSQVKGGNFLVIKSRYPITLNSSGINRDLGTLTLIVQGIGGSSATRATLKWKEIR